MQFTITFKTIFEYILKKLVLCIQIRFVSTEKTTRIASRASCYIIVTKVCTLERGVVRNRKHLRWVHFYHFFFFRKKNTYCCRTRHLSARLSVRPSCRRAVRLSSVEITSFRGNLIYDKQIDLKIGLNVGYGVVHVRSA